MCSTTLAARYDSARRSALSLSSRALLRSLSCKFVPFSAPCAASSVTSSCSSQIAARPASADVLPSIQFSFRGCVSKTTITGRGRASSPAPEGAHRSIFFFGRWHAGRDLRGATHPSENTQDVCVLHLEEPPTEDGAGFLSRTDAVFSARHLHNHADRIHVARSMASFGATA